MQPPVRPAGRELGRRMSDFTLLPPSAPSHWPNPAGSQRPEELTGSPERDQGKEAGRGDEMNRKRMTDPGSRRHAAGTPPTSPSPACTPSLQKCPWPSGSPWTGKLCARPAPRPGPTTDSGLGGITSGMQPTPQRDQLLVSSLLLSLPHLQHPKPRGGCAPHLFLCDGKKVFKHAEPQ